MEGADRGKQGGSSESDEDAASSRCRPMGDTPDDISSTSSTCRVCGDLGASLHYGAVSCVGCKGFFRRALKKADQINCSEIDNCDIKLESFPGGRTACRACRLRKCLEVGMQPSAYTRKARRKSKPAAGNKTPPWKKTLTATDSIPDEDWSKRLSVEMKTTLMTLLNMETRIAKGDTSLDASKLYPLHVNTLKEIMDHPDILKGKRSAIRYEPYRMADNSELSSIAYRRLIAAVDWVEFLAELIDGGLSADDRIALVRSCFAPLMIFCFAARTAQVTQDENVLCLCNFAFVPRDIANAFDDAYHLGNGIVGRALDELVSPYRRYGILEEELVCISAIIVLNPLARELSEDGQTKVLTIRHRIQDALYAVVKEARTESPPSVTFGNLLLTLEPVTTIHVQNLANAMCENLVFAQTFSTLGGITLLTNLFGCFPVEPFTDAKTDTLEEEQQAPREDTRKEKQFRLLQAPGYYTITEMFDDLEEQQSDDNFQSTLSYYQMMAPSCSNSQPVAESSQVYHQPPLNGHNSFVNLPYSQPKYSHFPNASNIL